MAVRKSKKGASLKRWFKEEWIDVKTGKPCGRLRLENLVDARKVKTAGSLTADQRKEYLQKLQRQLQKCLLQRSEERLLKRKGLVNLRENQEELNL